MNDELVKRFVAAGMSPDSAKVLAAALAKMKPEDAWESLVDNGVPPDTATAIAHHLTPPEPAEPSPSWADYGRAAGMGATFGFLDELKGLGAALVPGGQGYTEARDEMRQNYDAARAAYPKRMLAAELGGGLLSGLATGGLMPEAMTAAEGAGAAIKAGKAAMAGAAMGGVSGLGHSDKDSLGGLAIDTGLGAGIGGLLGGAGSLIASGVGGAVKKFADGLNPERVVEREGSTLLPPDAGATLTRQEQLAPGTAVVGDLTPTLTKTVQNVGAHNETAVPALQAAKERLATLQAARRQVGDAMENLQADIPIDDELRAILHRAGKFMTAPEIPLRQLQLIAAKLKDQVGKGGVKAMEKGPVLTDLNEWLFAKVPELKQLNSNYRFLSQRIEAAQGLAQQIEESLGANVTRRMGGAGEAGGKIPKSTHGLLDAVGEKLFKADRGEYAKVVQQLLLAPGDAAQTSLARLQAAAAAAGRRPMSSAARSALMYGLFPTAGGLLGPSLDQ